MFDIIMYGWLKLGDHVKHVGTYSTHLLNKLTDENCHIQIIRIVLMYTFIMIYSI